MIWLLLHQPTPPSLISKLDRCSTERLRKRDNLLTEEVGGGAKNYTTGRKPGPL
jgi:hypothetical protein